MTDEITLTLPRERDFVGVAHLVVGGLAARIDLTYDHLEDLKLALEALLRRERQAEEVTVALRVAADGIEARVGPFEDAELQAELLREHGVGLRRLLETVGDEVEVESEADGVFVHLRKHVELGGSRGG